MILVQTILPPGDIPIATTMTLFFQLFGSTVLLGVAEAVFLNQLLVAMQAIDPSITLIKIIQAGATGIGGLVSGDKLQNALTAYAKCIGMVFIAAAALGAIAVLVACGMEWRNIKVKNNEPEEYDPRNG